MSERESIPWKIAIIRIIGGLAASLGIGLCILEFCAPRIRPNHGEGEVFGAGVLPTNLVFFFICLP